MKYTLTHPCSNCPFRSDIAAYIKPERVREIEASLEQGSFPCHKTIDYDTADDETGDPIVGEDAQHCAGAMILLEKLDRPTQMMRICERIGMYDRRKLQMDAPVYDSFDEMEEACERAMAT